MKHIVLTMLSIAGALLCCAVSVVAAEKEPPNIVFILADDQGWIRHSASVHSSPMGAMLQ